MVDEDIIAGWDAMKAEGQERRASNRENSAELLRAAGIPFVTKNNGAHLIVAEHFDFWPGTGKWKQRTPGTEYRRGVKSLVAAVRALRVSAEAPRDE